MDFLQELINYKINNSRDDINKRLSIEHFENYRQESFDRKFINSGHFTASGIVFNKEKTHILLTHHKFLNKWLQLGGHIDKTDSSVMEAALRECVEESGIKNLELLDDNIFDIDIHFIPENIKKNEKPHNHYDIRYLFVANNDNFILSDESFDLKWLEVDEVLNIEDLKNIAIKLSAYK